MITTENYTYSCFTSKNMKAFISFGMAPGDQDLSYYITVLENDEYEVFQSAALDSLQSACDQINKKYERLWSYTNLTLKQKSDSGCSTCVAH